MRKFLITAASVASVVAVVAIAPSALALNESAQLSSLDSGMSISGSVSTTFAGNRNVLVEMYAQSSRFSRPVGNPSTVNCATYGISLKINGSPQVISTCYNGSNYVGVDTTGSTSLSAGDVVTLTWGPGLVTSTGSLSGATIEVYNLDTSNFVTVTPTLASSSSSAGDAASVLMWQQAYGRASATDSCQDGYTPSWATWPNGGAGGFVCNRFVPEYGN